MTTPEWSTFTLSDIEEVKTFLGWLETGAQVIDDVFALISDALEVAAAALSVVAEGIIEAMAAIKNAMQILLDAIWDMINIGLYFLYDVSNVSSNPLFADGVSGVLGRVDSSFDDLGDSMRPQYTDSAEVLGHVFLMGANNFPSIVDIINLIRELFGIPEIDFNYTDTDLSYPEFIVNGMSTPPDWHSQKISDILRPYEDIKNLLEFALNMLDFGTAIGELIGQFVEIIKQKIQILDALNEKIQSFIDAIEALIALSGMYMLQVKSNTGLPGFRAGIQESIGKPTWDSQYVIGFCMLTGGPAGSTDAFEASMNFLFKKTKGQIEE